MSYPGLIYGQHYNCSNGIQLPGHLHIEPFYRLVLKSLVANNGGVRITPTGGSGCSTEDRTVVSSCGASSSSECFITQVGAVAHSVASEESDIPPSPFSSFSVSRRAVISLDRTHCELKAFSPKVRSRLPRRECTQLSCPCVGILFQVVRRTLYGVRRVELHLGIDSALDGCFFWTFAVSDSRR